MKPKLVTTIERKTKRPIDARILFIGILITVGILITILLSTSSVATQV